MNPSSPQAPEMAHESMVRNLEAQAQAIWPQERPIFLRHAAPKKILDVGCGTGEITARLAEMYPDALLTGIDVEQGHLERARQRCKNDQHRVRFEQGDAMNLRFDDAQFDLAVCRHLLQAVPNAAQVLKEMTRVLKPGGRLHLLAEDYGMLWAHPTRHDSDEFWQKYLRNYGQGVGCDLYVGRKMFTLLHDLNLRDIAVDYLVIDTLRVPRETFARIWDAWREGYAASIARHSGTSPHEVDERFKDLIEAVTNPRGYALWQVPLWTARK